MGAIVLVSSSLINEKIRSGNLLSPIVPVFLSLNLSGSGFLYPKLIIFYLSNVPWF
jgi:hypothetical protein